MLNPATIRSTTCKLRSTNKDPNSKEQCPQISAAARFNKLLLSDGKRVYRKAADATETMYFYGVKGERLPYQIGPYAGQLTGTPPAYFAGRRLGVATDRLGSVRVTSYYPYGEQQTTTAEDDVRFATYVRDGATGLDYAMNRYYSSIIGRFMSPDPSARSMLLANPASWNRYGYVGGDPVNNNDPSGLGEDAESFCDVYPDYWLCHSDFYSSMLLVKTGFGFLAGGGVPYYRRHPCDTKDATNARIINFMKAHKADAKELAAEVSVPWELVLAVSAEETKYGTLGIVTKTNNFFGLHVHDVTYDSHYLNQTGVYTTGTLTKPVCC